MKKTYLLLVTCLIIFSCSKDIGDVSSDSLNENKLTKEEAIVVANHLMGQTITPTEALSEAEALIAFLDQNSSTTRSTPRSIGNIVVATGNKVQTRSGESSDSDTLAYIVNFANDMGYAFISADRRTETILSMSPEGNIDLENDEINPGLDIFFANAEDMYEQQILSAEDAEVKLLEEALAKMNEGNVATRAVGYTTRVGSWENYSTFAPLVKVNWGQTSPFNDNAPLINGKRAYAGCVATAIAQIMSHHQYPTSYNWTEINKFIAYYYPASTTVKNEIARMFRTIGDNVKMQWGSDPKKGSGACSSDVPNCFSKMGYKKTGSLQNYDFNKIINSLSTGSPVYISGFATYYTHKHWFLGKRHTHYEGGHAWVLDGYLTRKRKVDLMSGTSVIYSYYQYETLVHCNYGWNGGSNGYYNSAAFDTNKGPETRAGEPRNYQFKLETLYDVKPF